MAADVGVTDVERHFSVQTGIPRMLLGEKEPLDLEDVEERLRRRVIGQTHAVDQLVQTVAVMKASLSPADKPLGVFLFVGPTGVGKTELARALAELVFGSEKRLSRFDMSEYADPSAATRLIRGTDRRDGLLTRVIRQQPFGIVLLDEIEKAHPAVYDLLLGALGEARLSDARGRTAYLHNTIVIMTSNVGARANKQRIGIGASESTDLDRYVDAAREHFRPEFLNRLDRLIPFHPLSTEEIRRIARIQLRAISRRRGLTELGVELDVADEVLDHLAVRGYSEDYGARALRRTLEDELVVPVAELLAREAEGARSATVVAAMDDEGQMRLGLTHGEGPAGGERGRSPFHRIAEQRRAVDAWYHLPPLIQLREQVDFLVAQMNDLARAKKAKARKRASALMPKLAADHSRLEELATRLSSRRADLCAVEELAFAGHLAGREEDQQSQLDEALSAVTEFRASLPYALLALHEHRDAATFVLQQPDANDGLARWLLPLFEAARIRGYHLAVHVPVSITQPNAASWPAGRFWGPPQSAAWAKEKLRGPNSALREVLLTVKGPYAGVLLALESGLHRWIASSDRGKTAHLSVTLASMRSELTSADHESKLFRPRAMENRATLLRMPAMREHDVPGETLRILHGDVALPLPDDYWAVFEETATEHLIAVAASGRAIADAIAIVPVSDDGDEDRSEGGAS
jgi:ATP-dependent Clp protease ATP-binding subunit ClpC